MVKLALQIKATLENITDLKPLGEDFGWQIKAQCQSCREEHPNWMTVDATETREISGSRGEANLVWRCQMCKREHTICPSTSLFAALPFHFARPPGLSQSIYLPNTFLPVRTGKLAFDDSFKRDKAAYTLEQSEEQKFGTLAVVECRGCEVTQFDPKGVWTAKGAESNTVFDEVEISLEEPEWNDYDEKSSEPVSVMEVETKVQRA
ncbi:hypothetical protein JCM11251_002539 [Rhodosporidiobolus azoricus]